MDADFDNKEGSNKEESNNPHAMHIGQTTTNTSTNPSESTNQMEVARQIGKTCSQAISTASGRVTFSHFSFVLTWTVITETAIQFKLPPSN